MTWFFKYLLIIGLFIIQFISCLSLARPSAEINFIYLSSGLVASSTSTSSNMGFDLSTYFPIDNKDQFFAGWQVFYLSASSVTTSTETLGIQNISPAIRWAMGDRGIMTLSFSYCLNGKATYANGTTTEAWSGTAMFAQLAFNPQISENWNADLALNYFSASFSKSVDSTTLVESAVSYSKSFIFPTIGFRYRF